MRFRHDHHPFAHQGRDHGHEHGREHRHGPFGRGGPRGGRSGRFFDQGDLRLVILALLVERPRHGYEIIKDIEDRLGGAYAPSPGVVYPTLTLLEELGYATVTADGAKKLYAPTPEGLAYLEQNRAAVDGLFARMDQAGPSRDLAPRIFRAMGNLKLALRLRLGSGNLSAEQVDKIADALDAAAHAIERS